MGDPEQVRSMFARIAPSYDLLNRTLSMGVDQRWRRRTVARAAEHQRGLCDKLAVDVCSGTGDLAFALSRAGARVVGVDFTLEMLERTKAKRGHASTQPSERRDRPLFVQGDALALPFGDGVADLVTCAFGVRNLGDSLRGLREFRRIVRRGGLVLVLEFTRPPSRALRAVYLTYFQRILPWIGGVVSGDREAYRYLPRSVANWPDPAQFQSQLEQAGLEHCGRALFSGGIACLHWGQAG